MSEYGKMFRAMTWIDDKYVLEAENWKKNTNKKNIKYLVVAAMIACAILITGTNSEVQATLKSAFSQIEHMVFPASAEKELADPDFSRLPENIQVKGVEIENENFRLYELNNANGDTIWLFQQSNYTDDGSGKELTVEAEGTITRQEGMYGTYWEIEEGDIFGIIWEKNGNMYQIANASSMEEARDIYLSLVK